ncbi:MAG: TOMM precursor leader peptide-binding protein [Heliobacteriaceae bacterium]|nr:TOMM precursor leader peptide-binding protein [Heliobacteriaceae bacterium]
MVKKPVFKYFYRVETVIDEQAVFLLSERKSFLLKGRLYALLAPLLDGSRTVDEIINRLIGQASPAEVEYALKVMESKGYIEEGDDFLSREQAAFWSALGSEAKDAAARLQSIKVSVTSFGGLPINQLVSLLAALNVQVGEPAGLGVVLTDDYLHPGLAEYNRRALETGLPWVLAKPAGTVPWLGPVFYPGETACWACLATRLRGNREVSLFVEAQKDAPGSVNTSFPMLPSTTQTALALLTTEIARWVVKGESELLKGKLISFDAPAVKLEQHHVIRRPQCPKCNAKESGREPSPPVLVSQRKGFTADGGHRIVSPEETLKKYAHQVSPITGVVKTLERVTAANANAHVYSAGHNWAIKFHNLKQFRNSLRSSAGGKGKSDIQARAGALCEAIERYSGVFQGDEYHLRGSFCELGEKAIHPNACMNYSAEQYKNRAEINAREVDHQFVPVPFNEEAVMDWTPVWSLSRATFHYLPTSFLYYNHPTEGLRSGLLCCSNGNASGNTLEEAILQGFFELVERDSVALWWYNRLNKPGVALESFQEPYFKEMEDYYRSVNREYWLLDITSDFGIPSFAALSRRTDQEAEDIMYGFGCHFDPVLAALRALTEMSQTLPLLSGANIDAWKMAAGQKNRALSSLSGKNQDGATLPGWSLEQWRRKATVANQPYLLPDRSQPSKRLSDYRNLATDDLLEDIHICRRLVEGLGMEMFILDQTRPDIGLNVVKVIVPGMRHFWARFAPGRLYDVPVKMGWLDRPNKESELNPIPPLL